MADKWNQNDSIMAVSTDLKNSNPNDFEEGTDPVLLSGLVGREGISTLFNYEMRLLSTNHQIKPEDLIGTNVTITLRLDVKKDKTRERFINGFVSRFKILGPIKDNEFRVYEAEVVPWIWVMTLVSDCRIFQKMTVVDVLREMFTKHKAIIDLAQVKATYPQLEYCVQYRESDFDFVSRLMEEYGIFYYFKHQFGRHILVLSDSNSDLSKFDKKPIEFMADQDQENLKVTRWKHIHDHRIGEYTHTDYNYEFPRNDLVTRRKTTLKVPKANPWERFDYHGRYKETSAGELLAKIRMEEEEARSHTVEGSGTHAGFESGRVFTLKKEDLAEDNNKDYVITALELTAYEPRYTEDSFWDSLLKSLPDLLLQIGKGAGGAVAGSLIDIFKGIGSDLGSGLKTLGNTVLGGIKDPIQKWAEDRKSSAFDHLEPGYKNQFFCVPFELPIRSPRTTKRPEIRGPQTAFVVGPSGKEIWTDELGRVKVKFHWDRHVTKPENATCWIRFSEAWAGREWGTLHPPRVGQEVIVDFLQADPDLPIITGRVYNGVNKPAFTLPKYQTRSGIKTRTTPGSGKTGYHMLRFEDQAGQEQLLLRSQRRTDFRTYASYFETTHANRHFLIGYNDPDTEEKGGNAHLTIGGEWNLHTGKGRYEGMDDVYHLRVTGEGINSYEACHALMVKSLLEINAQAIHIEAKAKISLKVGGSFITIDPSGIAIKGPIVQINSGGSADAVSDKTILDPVDASISDNGEPGYLEHLREQAARGGGGGHRQRTVSAQHGPNVARNADGSLQFGPGIRIDGSNPDYASRVTQELITMSGTAEGQRLLNSLNSSGRQTTIQPGNPPPNPPNAFAEPGTGTKQDYANATPAGQPVFDGNGNPINDASGNQMVGTGQGGNSRITYNPEQWPDPTSHTKAPGDAILFHEMTHSDNQTQGAYDGSPRTDNFDTNEEFNTIGPENRYRDERGIPRRNDHHDL